MGLYAVDCGKNIPDEVNVVIEIPAHSGPVKYEVEKDSGAMFVDRFMSTAMFYPCNYGYVPKTLSDDGDPVDVLVITPVPLISGSVVTARPIGMLDMTDEAGNDAKVLAVPTDKLTDLYKDVKSPEDVSSNLTSAIAHFFEHYKDLESGKWVKIKGWRDAEAAKNEIRDSIMRYKDSLQAEIA